MNSDERQAADELSQWFGNDLLPGDSRVSASRDVFQARLDTFLRSFLKSGVGDGYLLAAVVGELGNNAFDHNIGQWPASPGCWFRYLMTDVGCSVWVVDRGRGIRATLARIDPTIKDDQAALVTAFSLVISGRSPERRGNGLKFVRSAIDGYPNRGLLSISGTGEIRFGGNAPGNSRVSGRGVFHWLRWGLQS